MAETIWVRFSAGGAATAEVAALPVVVCDLVSVPLLVWAFWLPLLSRPSRPSAFMSLPPLVSFSELMPLAPLVSLSELMPFDFWPGAFSSLRWLWPTVDDFFSDCVDFMSDGDSRF